MLPAEWQLTQTRVLCIYGSTSSYFIFLSTLIDIFANNAHESYTVARNHADLTLRRNVPNISLGSYTVRETFQVCWDLYRWLFFTNLLLILYGKCIFKNGQHFANLRDSERQPIQRVSHKNRATVFFTIAPYCLVDFYTLCTNENKNEYSIQNRYKIYHFNLTTVCL